MTDIRILNENDAEKYREIRLEGLKNFPHAFSSSFEEEREFSVQTYGGRLKGEHTFTFGAFNDGNLLGVVTLIFEQKRKLKHRANIVAMYVSSESQGTGLGRALMTTAIEKAKTTDGIEQIYLMVSSNNKPAKTLYQSLGFETYGKEAKSLKVDDQYFDEDLMVLYI